MARRNSAHSEMVAAVVTGPGMLDLRHLPVPDPGEGVLLRVLGCGVCGSDRRQFAASREGEDKVIGHEIVGEVADAAPRFSEWLGKTFGVAPRIGCRNCPPCTRGFPNLCERTKVFGYQIPGGFAQFAAVPPEAVVGGNLVEVPSGLETWVATLAEPLSCVINGMEISRSLHGKSMLVVGAGPMGQMFVMLAARESNRVHVAEPDPARRDFALAHGAEAAYPDVSEAPRADLTVVACSSPEAYTSAFERAPPGSTINLFGGLPQGIEMDSNEIHYRQLVVHGTSGSTPSQYAEAMRVLEHEGSFRDLVTETIGLDQLEVALKGRSGGRLRLKSVVDPWIL